MEDQNQITASVIIQQWYHSISYQRLELEQEFLMLENHQLDDGKHLAEDEHQARFELQQRLELEHECFLLKQQYLEEQVAYF